MTIKEHSEKLNEAFNKMILDCRYDISRYIQYLIQSKKLFGRRIVYISLPITGVKESDIMANIIFAKMKINAIGNIGVSSYKPNDTNKPYSYYMAKSIKLLLECDAIYLCKGWKKSKGCRAEYEVAKIYGKKIIKQ